MRSYIYKGDIYCEGCAVQYMDNCHKEDTGDSEDYPQQICDSGEADTPQHCGDCHEFLENPLTEEGWLYVQDSVKKNRGDKLVLKQWRDFYEIQT